LASGQDDLRKDNAAIETEKANMWTLMGKLREYNELATALDGALENKVAELEAAGRTEDANTVRSDALFPVRQRRQDIMTQMAVSVQGYMALDLIRRNNLELIRGVDRAQTTTIAALLAVLLLAACGSSSSSSSSGSSSSSSGSGLSEAASNPNATLIVNNAVPIATLDPGLTTNDQDPGFDGAMYSTLTQVSQEAGKVAGTTQQNLGVSAVKPYIAKSYAFSNGNKTLTFQIRPGLKFPSGDAVDAKAVVWSIERDIKLEEGGYSVLEETDYTPPLITSVKATGPLTVVFQYKRPAPNQLQVLSTPTAGALADVSAPSSPQHRSQFPQR